jgi:hypothetical protein
MLISYLQQVRRLIGDPNFVLFNDWDLTDYINAARQEVAAQGQCVRITPPWTGSVATMLTVPQLLTTQGGAPISDEMEQVELTTQPGGPVGSGYTDYPTVTVPGPDQPGFGPASIWESQINNTGQVTGFVQIQAQSPSGGYTVPPVPTITSSPAQLPTVGTGAGAVTTLTPFNQTVAYQEEYPFSYVNTLLPPGYGQVLAVKSVTILWSGNATYSLTQYSATKYAALVGVYTNFFGPPVWMCQYGQGENGTIRMFPLPDTTYPMKWDCLCVPADLVNDQSVEVIPRRWQPAISFYAAFLALMSTADNQRVALGLRYYNERDQGLFGAAMRRARAQSQPGYAASYYGRA